MHHKVVHSHVAMTRLIMRAHHHHRDRMAHWGEWRTLRRYGSICDQLHIAGTSQSNEASRLRASMCASSCVHALCCINT